MPFESEENEVRTYLCDGWEEYIIEVKKERVMPLEGGFRGSSTVLFRGHSDSTWKLSSTLERDLLIPGAHRENSDELLNLRQMNGVKWYEEQCDMIYSRFSENATGLPDLHMCRSDIDRWVIGRHYGLLSPYLDWTRSPFVAAFFAYEKAYKVYEGLRSGYPSNFDGFVTVWGLRFWDEAPLCDEFELTDPVTSHATRPRAQCGAFTKLTSAKHIDLESYFRSRSLAHYLERYDVSLRDATTAFRDLELMNISYLTLFPDVAGAAWSANMQTHWLKYGHMIAAAS